MLLLNCLKEGEIINERGNNIYFKCWLVNKTSEQILLKVTLYIVHACMQETETESAYGGRSALQPSNTIKTHNKGKYEKRSPLT